MKTDALRLYAEIDLDAAAANLKALMSCIKPAKTAVMAVIKANGYGHDDCSFAKVLEEHGVHFFGVSNIHEAIKLRTGGCTGDILILGYTPPEYTEKLLQYDIIQTVTGLPHALSLAEQMVTDRSNADQPAAGEHKSDNRKLRVHIKVDTGMSRLGIKLDDFDGARAEVVAIADIPQIAAEGIFTHLAAADSSVPEDLDFTTAQIECFFYLAKECEQAGISFLHRHCFNSAGGLIHYDPRSTLVRFGIALYGLKPDVNMKLPVKLTPVMSLKSHVAEVKQIRKGETVSYGRTFTARHEMTAAVVTVGYADGYPRSLSSFGNSPNGYMLINGHKARILGRVCMDQTVVDVTDIPDVTVGSAVTLIGTDGEATITADDLAIMANTIGYEIVCGIGLRVPRLIYRGGELVNVIDYYSTYINETNTN
jgi:alanine racemase